MKHVYLLQMGLDDFKVFTNRKKATDIYYKLGEENLENNHQFEEWGDEYEEFSDEEKRVHAREYMDALFADFLANEENYDSYINLYKLEVDENE